MRHLSSRLVSAVVAAVVFVGVPSLPASNNSRFYLSDLSKVSEPVRIDRVSGNGTNAFITMVATNVTGGPVTLVARRGDILQTAERYQNYMVASADGVVPRPATGGVLGLSAATADDFGPSRAEYAWNFDPFETKTIHLYALCVIYDKDPLPRNYNDVYAFSHTDRFENLFRAVDRANAMLADSAAGIPKLTATAVLSNGRVTINPYVYNVAIWMAKGVRRQQLIDKLVTPRLNGGPFDALRVSAANEMMDAGEELLALMR